MGAMQNNPKERRGKKRSSRRRKSVTADWSEANAENIYYLIIVVSKFDGAVRFGRSRDGGAYAIGVYGDGDPWTDYLPGNQDVNEWLLEIITELDDSPGAASVPQPNS